MIPTKIKRNLGKAILSASILWCSYNYLVGIIGGLPSRPIRSISELEKVIQEERIKLGIGEDENIGICFSDQKPYARRIGENFYEVNLGLPKNLDLKVVKHELFHIAAGHADKNPNRLSEFFKYFLIYEPKATIYQTTGIRL